jgi:hypothetical protein
MMLGREQGSKRTRRVKSSDNGALDMELYKEVWSQVLES